MPCGGLEPPQPCGPRIFVPLRPSPPARGGMRIPITVVVAAVMCAGSAAVAQTAPSHSPQQGSSASIPDMLKPQSPISGIETLSDTEGIDEGLYLVQWYRITEGTLQSLISKELNPATLQSGTMVIRFKILPSGQLMDGGTVLERGQARLDKAVFDAIGGSAYPRLPEEFHGAYLEFLVDWLYDSRLAKYQNRRSPSNRPFRPFSGFWLNRQPLFNSVSGAKQGSVRLAVHGRLIWRWSLDVVDDDFLEWDFNWHQL